MSALKNPKWEHFAQELFRGKTQIEAYTEAGYKPDSGAANRLSGNVSVQHRIAELQGISSLRAEVTLASLMREADEIQALAMEVKQLSAASNALTIKAKLAGLWIERKEVGRPGEFEGMNADELRDYIARTNAELGAGVASASHTNGSGKPH